MELTNKKLAMLLVVAMAISLGGTMISLQRLDRLASTTGFATSNSTGITLLNISSQTSLVFSVATVDFGNGSVNSTGGFNNCTMFLNGSTTTFDKTGCIGFNTVNPSGTTFVIENTGTTNLNVTLNSTKNATAFIGGDASVVKFQYTMSNNESSSCTVALSNQGWTDVTTVDTNICYNMSFLPATNSLMIGVRVVVPITATEGGKQSTFVATGLSL